MDSVCHRCGTALSSPEMFCPHCGAPQLLFNPADEQAPFRESSGQGLRASGKTMDWRAAVQSALLLALPVGLLSSLLDFGVLVMLAGGFCAVALYRRKTLAVLNSSAGWRIGMLAGVLAAFLSSMTDGLSMLVERYGLHRGTMIDQRLGVLTQQMTDQMAHQNPEAAQQIPWFLNFWLSPDGHAAIVLFMSIFAALMMIAFSAVGGALGARVLGARQRLSTNS